MHVLKEPELDLVGRLRHFHCTFFFCRLHFVALSHLLKPKEIKVMLNTHRDNW